MPATEQTWRNQKLLHVVFAVSGVAMLGATIWMFAADHFREWKPIQRTFIKVETDMSAWQQQQYLTSQEIQKHAELEAALAAARSRPIDGDQLELLKKFKAEVESDAKRRKVSEDSFKSIDESVKALNAAAASKVEKGSVNVAAERLRGQLLDSLRTIVQAARFREERLLDERKVKNAILDKQKADLDLAVRDNRSADVMAAIQTDIDAQTKEIQRLTLAFQDASEHRKNLQGLIGELTAAEVAAAKAVEDKLADVKRLENAIAQTQSTYFVGAFPWLGKRWLELPIIDAFGSPRKIDNLWDNQNTIDFNFARVRRYDRCTTCHQAMEKSAPGSATEPAYVHERLVTLTLATPAKDKLPDPGKAPNGAPLPLKLEDVYGIRLAGYGLIDRNDVTVSFVKQESLGAKAELKISEESRRPRPAAEIREALLQAAHESAVEAGESLDSRPGLTVGDVIVSINGDKILDAKQAERLLTGSAVKWGDTIQLTIRRGLPNPYTSHPRLDLFVGSPSPHKLADFACTICHEGQGSATAFKFASHTPNDPEQREDWFKQYGWFDNHHWIFPQYPKRFAESACLKCHHSVVELEASERFPDPPAPKVVHGYNVMRKYGCYGCHEINGYDGPDKRVGPDLRLEPNFFAAALQLKADPGFAKLSEQEHGWIEELIDHPERDATRRRLLEALTKDEQTDEPKLSSQAHQKLVPLLKDIEVPGSLRRPGPSLRYAAHKLNADFVYDWVREPKHFRPSTRMPQFFGLWNHLEGETKAVAQRYEPVELLGMATYLLERSQPFEYLTPPEGMSPTTPDEAVARGKTQFQTRGCLACHTHKEFPDAQKFRSPEEIVQGPDLSGVAEKFASENGKQWLYSWIKQPSRYHARTVMPDLFLDPITEKDMMGAVVATHDPVADIVAYLLANSTSGWKPAPGTLTALDDTSRKALNDLALEHLKDVFYIETAEKYLKQGIPADRASELKGAEIELVGQKITDKQRLLYIGRKSIGKYGCYGCHDIPGFEDAKPIGTGLADWGRKDPSKLAFEHILHYLDGHGHGGDEHAHGGSEHGEHADVAAHDDSESASDRGFFMEALHHGHRAGFIYQKLREPRSYDYRKTENKKYNERLRMPQFPLSAADREAVIAFVLGLVADPPNQKYLYAPSPRQDAIIKGRVVLEKYNCGGCHVLDAEKWQVAYSPDAFPVPAADNTYPFLASHFTPAELKESTQTDRRGLLHATLSGVPAIDNNDGLPEALDFEGDPLGRGDFDPTTVKYGFSLLRPAVLNGHVFEVQQGRLQIPASMIEKKYPTDGGYLTKYLLPHVVALEKQANPNAKGSEAWGWLPPPLVGEGRKVQAGWLHDFLLQPYPIRPAVFLRMPRFNMSPDEATQLVNYFAARDNAEFPYEFNDTRQPAHLAAAEQQYEGDRFGDAMKIVTYKDYCIKCHIVGDFEPGGADRAKAPNLSRMYTRLRTTYVRNWIAKPDRTLPYTGMPDIIKYSEGVPQTLYHGTSTEQLDAVVDWLMNYDEFAKRQALIAPLVKAAAEQQPAEAAPPAPDTTSAQRGAAAAPEN
jgi:cytochrome c2